METTTTHTTMTHEGRNYIICTIAQATAAMRAAAARHGECRVGNHGTSKDVWIKAETPLPYGRTELSVFSARKLWNDEGIVVAHPEIKGMWTITKEDK